MHVYANVVACAVANRVSGAEVSLSHMSTKSLITHIVRGIIATKSNYQSAQLARPRIKVHAVYVRNLYSRQLEAFVLGHKKSRQDTSSNH
eukprot:6188147-Pleurochrysis_carterae.AAC.2